ncbi:energy-coupling factor transporter transmembrane component T [Candidatus Phytoplasma solani]|uniref:ABC-type cobalt transport system, permease component n=3 Tax=Candidatus Phytoplasma solani TaxID=69896 RepID=A0A421NXQ7_9MOLU|nr:energy-coupling factor transporter transmembrane component T [Candidatus Phytoplasma solani]RMI88821.1 ABC-type cobalt transport system, permease component [Candidatus Phytoplasma solani]CCP88260.1 ABC-type cobalt transport system, permease component [Candidatus Phytoplasma solani]CCP88788.1 ABC-type cobalt transport protein CbiQ [Candidatus Phytoplasma solani]
MTKETLQPILTKKIHPSVKIITFILLLIFVLRLPIDISVTQQAEKKAYFQIGKIIALYLTFFLPLLLLCFRFGLTFAYFYSKIKHLRFFFLISLILQLQQKNTSHLPLTFEIQIFDYNIYAFGVLVLCFIFYQITKKITPFQLSYLLLLLFLFFVLPTFLNDETKKNYYCLKLVSFFRIFFIMFRLLMIVMLFFLFDKIASFQEIHDGIELLLAPLKKLKIPVETFTLMLSLVFMANSFLLQETNKILKAQMSRGMDLNKKNIFKKINHLLSLLVPIFVLVFKRSIILSNAMEIRGYVLGAKRTKMIVYRLQKRDFLIISSVLLLFCLNFFINQKLNLKI